MTVTPNDRQAEANSHSDHPAAEHDRRGEEVFEPERLLARQDLQAVDLQPGQRAGVRSGGQHQMGRLIQLVLGGDGGASVLLSQQTCTVNNGDAAS